MKLRTPGKENMRHIRYILLLLFFLPLTAAQAQVWEEVGTMPTARADMATATLGDTLYLIGGSVPGPTIPIASNTVVRFNLDQETFLSNAPSMTYSRIGAEAVVYEGYIFVFGGRRDEENYVAEIEIWRPGMEEWLVVGSLQTARSGMRGIVRDGAIYMTGGSSGPLVRLSQIDQIIPYLESSPPSVSFQTVDLTLPSPRSHHALIEFNGNTYLFGGYSIWPLGDCYRWDTDGFTRIDSLTTSVGGMGVATITISNQPYIAATGGRSINGELASNQYMNYLEQWVPTGTGQILPNLPTARVGHAFVSVEPDEGCVVYVFGGSYENISGQKVLLDDVLTFTRGGTSSYEDDGPAQPGNLALKAYPNPSNGAVNITIAPSNVTSPLDVRIFDLLGREVTRWSLPASPGKTVFSWDGSRNGREIAGGVYFLVARNGEQQQVLKLFRMP